MTERAQEKLLDAHQVAKRLDCSRSKAYAIMQDEMPHVRIGGLLRVELSVFEEWLRSCERFPGDDA